MGCHPVLQRIRVVLGFSQIRPFIGGSAATTIAEANPGSSRVSQLRRSDLYPIDMATGGIPPARKDIRDRLCHAPGQGQPRQGGHTRRSCDHSRNLPLRPGSE